MVLSKMEVGLMASLAITSSYPLKVLHFLWLDIKGPGSQGTTEHGDGLDGFVREVLTLCLCKGD